MKQYRHLSFPLHAMCNCGCHSSLCHRGRPSTDLKIKIDMDADDSVATWPFRCSSASDLTRKLNDRLAERIAEADRRHHRAERDGGEDADAVAPQRAEDIAGPNNDSCGSVAGGLSSQGVPAPSPPTLPKGDVALRRGLALYQLRRLAPPVVYRRPGTGRRLSPNRQSLNDHSGSSAVREASSDLPPGTSTPSPHVHGRRDIVRRNIRNCTVLERMMSEADRCVARDVGRAAMLAGHGSTGSSNVATVSTPGLGNRVPMDARSTDARVEAVRERRIEMLTSSSSASAGRPRSSSNSHAAVTSGGTAEAAPSLRPTSSDVNLLGSSVHRSGSTVQPTARVPRAVEEESRVLTVLGWAVTAAVVRFARKLDTLCGPDILARIDARHKRAVWLLTKQLPAVFKMYRRRKRLKRLRVLVRVALAAKRFLGLRKRKALAVIVHSLRRLAHDQVFTLRRQLKRVRLMVRLSQGVAHCRRAHRELLRRQWDATEIMLLLRRPDLGLSVAELRSCAAVRWEGLRLGTPTAVPKEAVNIVTSATTTGGTIAAFVAWKQFASYWRRPILPDVLNDARCDSADRARAVIDFSLRRRTRQAHLAAHVYNTWCNEQLVAKGLLETAQRTHKAHARDDVARDHPRVPKDSAVFLALVDLHVASGRAPYIQGLLAAQRAAMTSTMPPVPRIRALAPQDEMEGVVEAALKHRKLIRLLSMTATEVPL